MCYVLYVYYLSKKLKYPNVICYYSFFVPKKLKNWIFWNALNKEVCNKKKSEKKIIKKEEIKDKY